MILTFKINNDIINIISIINILSYLILELYVFSDIFSLNLDTYGGIMYKRLPIEQRIRIDSLYTLFSDTREPNYHFEGERHNFWEVVCVMEGKVGVASENELYILNEGQAIFHSPMEFHNIWSENQKNTVFVFSFAGSMPALNHNVYNFGTQERILINEITEMLSKTFKYTGLIMNRIKPGMEQEAEKVVKKLELLITTLLSNAEVNVLDPHTKSAQNYLNIVSVLNDNTETNLTVEEIADMCNMSPSNLKKTFKKYSGVGIIKYFNELKVEKAQKLLNEGYTVKETAAALGYTDQNYFSVVFKRITGYSPIKYKNKR